MTKSAPVSVRLQPPLDDQVAAIASALDRPRSWVIEQAVKDYVSRDLFEKLMHDEEEHIDFLETQLDLVAKLGLQLYAQHHIGELEDDKD